MVGSKVVAWASSIAKLTTGEMVAIDGKAFGTGKGWAWSSLQGIVLIEAERVPQSHGYHRIRTRYFIASLLPKAAPLNCATRQHWGIENKLH